MPQEKLARLRRVFASSDQVLIAINADPDAMASALALKRLLWRRVAGVTIARINEIARPDNLAMIRLLKIKMVPLRGLDLTRFTRYVIIDSQPAHSSDFAGIAFDVVIDHHPATGVKARFVDVRPDWGAASSILTQYLRTARIRPSRSLATALCLGIKTDTSNFERAAIIEDINAFQFLFRHANQHTIRRIEQAEMSEDTLSLFQLALSLARVRRHRVDLYLGPVARADLCVVVADFFMRVHDVQWVTVAGLVDQKVVVIARSDGVRRDAGTRLERAFGEFGSAGGHRGMARAEIPAENVPAEINVEDRVELGRWVRRRLMRKRKR